MGVVKKYGNRRLYDTTESRYITLDELAERVRGGDAMTVIDAKTGKDLTQQTFAHIILESRGAAKLLPVPLLEQLVRMGDDSLAEFFGMYVAGALEMYLAARRGAQAVMPFNPMAAFSQNPFARMFGGWPMGAPVAAPVAPSPAPTAPPAAPARSTTADEVAALRRELDAIKEAMRRPSDEPPDEEPPDDELAPG